MASLKEDETRNVVPNWRDYNKTARFGEFGSSAAAAKPIEFFPIDEYVQAWQANQTIPYAGDLISAAILNGQQTNPVVLDAARFIVSHQDDATGVLIRTARSLITTPAEIAAAAQLTVPQKIERIKNLEESVKKEIQLLKRSRDYCCYNPIAYCELARCYVTLGQFEKAKEAMKIAVHLAPGHRYVSRSAARFFLHTHDEERARHIIASNPALQHDPWLLASEIAINTLMNRTSRYIKKGAEMIASKNHTPFSISELSSAIGSIEMMNGNKKKCRSFFKTALENPNDNSLAQAQFLLSKNSDLSFEFGDNAILPNAFEAEAIMAYIADDYSQALVTSVDWIEDMPFTRRPVQFAANIAYSFLKDYDTAIDILDLGLKANPNNPMLLNNKAYACALGGRTEEADGVIQEAKKLAMSDETRVCLIATEGLNEYRKGNVETGKQLYTNAIMLAKELSPDPRLANRALLNFTREEARADEQFDKSILEVVEKIPNDCKETMQLKEDIKAEIKQ